MGLLHCLSCRRLYSVLCQCLEFVEVPLCRLCGTDAECDAVCRESERELRRGCAYESVSRRHHYTMFYALRREELRPLPEDLKTERLARVWWYRCPTCDEEPARLKWVRAEGESLARRPPGPNFASCRRCNSANYRPSRDVVVDKLRTLRADRFLDLALCAYCNRVAECPDPATKRHDRSLRIHMDDPGVALYLLHDPCDGCRQFEIPSEHRQLLPVVESVLQLLSQVDIGALFRPVAEMLASASEALASVASERRAARPAWSVETLFARCVAYAIVLAVLVKLLLVLFK